MFWEREKGNVVCGVFVVVQGECIPSCDGAGCSGRLAAESNPAGTLLLQLLRQELADLSSESRWQNTCPFRAC